MAKDGLSSPVGPGRDAGRSEGYFTSIEDIRVGDVVLSKSDETGEISYRKVVNTFIRQTEAIYTVSFSDGTTVETTWNHPFRVKKQGHALEKFSIENTAWVQAKDLHPGNIALGADGQELAITDITIDERVETVYNFEAEEYHTYFVGEVGVWVHNDSKYSYDPSDPKIQKRIEVVREAIGSLRGLNNDAEALAILLENNLLGDGNLDDRLKDIFNATELKFIDTLVPGLHISGNIFGDKGYAEQLRDGSGNQTGHFLTALRLGLDPEVVNDNFLAKGNSLRKMLEERRPEVKEMSDNEIAVRLTIGHEKYADPGLHSLVTVNSKNPVDYLLKQFDSATTSDVKNFNKALVALGTEKKLNFAAAYEHLDKIKVNESSPKWAPDWARLNQGNSQADLRLSLLGFDMARKKQAGLIKTKEDSASYIRENLKK